MSLKEIYYNPKSGLSSAANLYLQAKKQNLKVTKKQVEEFIKSQAVSQIHKKTKPFKSYFPIKAAYKNQVWQIDLMDVSSIEKSNDHVHFLLCIVDIYSRYAYVRPVKNKTSTTVTDAMKSVLKIEHPKVIEADQGSEFISKTFVNLINTYNIEINYADIQDHNRQGVIERFNQTLRHLIERYRTAYDTHRYIDNLQDLVTNYNNTPHSSLGGETPSHPDHDKIVAIINKKESKADAKETDFKPNEKVRFVKNASLFDKGALPKFSSEVHTVKKDLGRSYVLDNDKKYKYYQLQPITTVEKPEITNIEKLDRPREKRERKVVRHIKKEGVEQKNIVSKTRERKPNANAYFFLDDEDY
jgi:transposase InsO family protein